MEDNDTTQQDHDDDDEAASTTRQTRHRQTRHWSFRIVATTTTEAEDLVNTIESVFEDRTREPPLTYMCHGKSTSNAVVRGVIQTDLPLPTNSERTNSGLSGRYFPAYWTVAWRVNKAVDDVKRMTDPNTFVEKGSITTRSTSSSSSAASVAAASVASVAASVGGGDTSGTTTKKRKKKGGSELSSCYWCFTLNNPPEGYYEWIKSMYEDDEKDIEYVVYGRETADTTGTFHLQGFVQFGSPITENDLETNGPSQRMFQAHWSAARRVLRARKYCCKMCKCGKYDSPNQDAVCTCGIVSEHGAFCMRKGKRTDLDEFKAAVEKGGMTMAKARKTYSEVVARYPKFATDYISDHRPMREVAEHVMYPWQRAMFDRITNYPPHDREVMFVVDFEGGKGKSWFAMKVAQATALKSRGGVMVPETATETETVGPPPPPPPPEAEAEAEAEAAAEAGDTEAVDVDISNEGATAAVPVPVITTTTTTTTTTAPVRICEVTAQYMTPGRFADMAYALNEDITVLLIDCPRARIEMLQYDFIEGVKNGLIFSSKYEARMKFLPKCHVVVFMNEIPDSTKLSADRYTIIQVDEAMARHYEVGDGDGNGNGNGNGIQDAKDIVDWETFLSYREYREQRQRGGRPRRPGFAPGFFLP